MLARLPSKMLTDKQIDLVRRSNHTVPLLPVSRSGFFVGKDA